MAMHEIFIEGTRKAFWESAEKFFMAKDFGDRMYWLGRAHGLLFILVTSGDSTWNVQFERTVASGTYNPLHIANGQQNDGQKEAS